MDIVQSKLLYFDFDGNFKREVISEAGATHAVCIDRQQVVHAKFLDDFWVNRDPKAKIQLLITDKDGKIVSQRSHHQENPELRIQLYDYYKRFA